VFDAPKHEDISNIIEERFGNNIGWPNIVKNVDYCFFPVDNRSSQQDDIIATLMTKIESVVKDADYVKEKRPLTWLRALDELLATKKSSLTLEESFAIAIAKKVETDAVPLFLSFLNER